MNPSSDIFVDNTQEIKETPRQTDTTVRTDLTTASRGLDFTCMGDSNFQSIDNILKTYTYIKNAKWDKTTKPLPSIPDQSTTVDDADVVYCAFPNEYFADSLIHSKIEFLNYWKSDVEFEVKVNNAPTQQGCLYLWYEPLRGSDFPLEAGTPRAGLAQQTSYPGAYLNLEETDTATLIVPFLWYQEYFDITVLDTMGRFHVSVVAPLDGDSAATAVDVIINVRCINPDIRVPTTRGSAFRMEVAEVQMGPEEPRDGKITQLAQGVGRVADAVAGFPTLAPVAKSVSWISRLVGSAASAFGFSKPISIQETKPIMRFPGFGMQQIEGVTPGLSAGAIQDNEIKHDRPGPDEMDFKYICEKPVLIQSKQISLPTFNVKGDTWLAMKTHPIPDELTYPLNATHDTVSGGPMQCLFTQFDKWRGTLIYDFELIKTKFHKGRLQVSWIPLETSDPGSININKAYTKIWDVGVSSKFQFKVPFVLPYGYANVGTLRKYNGKDQPGYTGILVVKVFNKFNYPDSVPHDLTLLVSLSGENMDFQAPFMNSRLAAEADLMPAPTPPTTQFSDTRRFCCDLQCFREPQDQVDGIACRECGAYSYCHCNCKTFTSRIAEAQSGYEDNFTVPFVNDRIGGEKFTSFRQLLRKHAKSTGARWYENHTLALATTFAFYSGSFSEFLNGHAPNKATRFTRALTTSDTDYESSANYPFILSSDGATFVKLPYYSRFPCLPTKSVYNRVTESGTTETYKAIGDDYHAWYLIAPPTLVLKLK
nr:hypothetical protein 2 [Wenzhou shrimp virus 4]